MKAHLCRSRHSQLLQVVDYVCRCRAISAAVGTVNCCKSHRNNCWLLQPGKQQSSLREWQAALAHHLEHCASSFFCKASCVSNASRFYSTPKKLSFREPTSSQPFLESLHVLMSLEPRWELNEVSHGLGPWIVPRKNEATLLQKRFDGQISPLLWTNLHNALCQLSVGCS